MAKNKSIDSELLGRVIAVIRAARDSGCPVGSPEVAPHAIRRWRSSQRRRIDPNKAEQRIEDLARGLAVRFERKPLNLVGPLIEDYRYLAEKIADVLSEA